MTSITIQLIQNITGWKKKYETVGVAIEDALNLKRKMYSCLVDDNGEHKKAKSVNKNVKNNLLNKKWFRHSTNTIQSKDHRIGTYKISKFFFLALIKKYRSKNIDVMD